VIAGATLLTGTVAEIGPTLFDPAEPEPVALVAVTVQEIIVPLSSPTRT
jgi:hypothetical protein